MSGSEPEKTLPEGADGDNSIALENDVYQVEIGETESGDDSGEWAWHFDGHTTLFHEFFAMQDAGQSGDAVAFSYDHGPLVDNEIQPFPDHGEPGETYEATMMYVAADWDNILEVKRIVEMDPSHPVFTMEYEITNIQYHGDGDDESFDLNFFQYADFDDGANSYWDDIGHYDAERTMVYTEDGDGGAYAGFSAGTEPIEHHVGGYPGYSHIRNDSLNNESRYPASGTGDPVVAMKWDLGVLEVGETASLTLQFGAETTSEKLKDNIEDPTELPSGLGGRVRGSTTVLSYAPGLSENENSGGNDLHAAFPNAVDKPAPLIPFFIEQDGGFYGDGITELPDDLQEALEARKTVEGLDGEFRKYRTRNTVKVSFDIEDEKTIDGNVEIRTNLPPQGETVFGTDDSLDLSLDPFDTVFSVPTSDTVVEEDMVDASGDNLVGRSIGSNDERVWSAHHYERYLTATKRTISRPDGTDVDAITVATLYGSSNPVTRHIANTFKQYNPASFLIPANPVIYAWIELTVGADGTRIVRVPDASVFPKHAAYLNKPEDPPLTAEVNGEKITDSGLELITETDTDSGGGYDVAVDEDQNNVWQKFLSEADSWKTPYTSTYTIYHMQFRNGSFDHPLMVYGKDGDGTKLSRSECLSRLPHEYPQSPHPEVLGSEEFLEENDLD